MKKFFLLIMASMMTISMMAGPGDTKAEAIDFDWNTGNVHPGGTLWYHVDLAPLYEEENPSLTLYVTNPSRDKSVKATLKATVAGETETKNYTVSPHEHQIYTANASMLVRLRQTEIYLVLTTDGEVRLSAKVFESQDLDETCKDARELKWDTETDQTKGYAAWWKVDISKIKDTLTVKKDAKVTITNIGGSTVNLKTGQSVDCPSSGVTKRNFTLAAGQSLVDTIPQSMIASVYPDELYFTIENLEQPVKIKVEMIDQPVVPIIPAAADMPADIKEENLRPTDTIVIPAGKTLYRISVKDMDSIAKYEPEFTYRNEGAATAHMTIKMAFERPAFGTTNTNYTLAAGQEEIVVYKKNMLDGVSNTVDSIYLLTITDQPINFYGRFKHVREGKACKTNIDFNWETGHTQEARTTQWYAVPVAEARDNTQDIYVHLLNLGSASATVKASLAFSCPYIDLQEITRTLAADGNETTRRLAYSTYAMLSDTVWVGLETSQDIKFWAETKPAQTKEPDEACLTATEFDWEKGVNPKAGTTTWYKINMKEVREKSAKFPTIVVQNLSTTNAVKIDGELSLECPDNIENQKRSITIAANGTYTKQLSRNLFENISQSEVYLRVTTTEDISVQIRLTEEAAGSSCSSAIPFNWTSGNTQAANANLWYAIDLSEVGDSDIEIHILNRDNAQCKGVAQLSYSCPDEGTPTIQDFKLAAKAEKQITIQNSALEMLESKTVYVNLQGTTSLRIWAKLLDPKPFETITGEGITLTPLKWNTLYTQTEDTVWYVIPNSEIQYIKNLGEEVTPVAHLIDASSSAKTIQAEAAFAFPITKQMMTKSQKLKAGQHFTDTVPYGTFEQLLKKDSIILRVVRRAGAGDFQFKAELVKAFPGNLRKNAIPVGMNRRYEQAANTEIWYKIKTADLKKDKNLYNKVLHVMSKNAGAGDAKVKVAVYDGFLSEDDLLGDRGEKTIKKGQGKSHNVPAQAVYGLGDVELYIKVRTTDSLVFESKFNGEYKAVTKIDEKQAKARLVVPNVDYTLYKNDTTWFQICLPYIQNNYEYIDASSLEYTLDGTAEIEVTATFQDTMKYEMPVRKRTVNKSGKHYNGSKPLRELIERGIKRAGYSYDLSSTAPDFIDSLLHRFITKDSVTFYFRVSSTEDIKLRLNTPQTKGVDNRTYPKGGPCENAMSFDWEHGNVNPKDQQTWYVAALDTVKLFKDDKDLRLYVANWSEEDAADVSASLSVDCSGSASSSLGDVSKNVAAGDTLKKEVSIDFIKASSTRLLFIEYNSTQTTHIWIEQIEKAKRDTLRGDTSIFVCRGATVFGHVIDKDSVIWNDTIRNIKDEERALIIDSIKTFKVFALQDPQVYDFTSQVTIARGKVLDITAADTWLKQQYADEKAANDTLKTITDITWQYAVYPYSTYTDIDPANLPTLASEHINLRYVAAMECETTIDTTILHTVRDTVPMDTCNFYRWAANDSLYNASTLDSAKIIDGQGIWGDSISYLNLTLTNPAHFDLNAVAKYGNRLLLIKRGDLEEKGYKTDSLYTEGGKVKVEWFEASDPVNRVREGYIHFNEDGSPLVGTFYAVVTIASEGPCGLYGRTQDIVCAAPAPAPVPALVPNMVLPGENINVINLDPEKETVIRVFTTEGLLQKTYTVRGENSFTIKAAAEHGFYLVELLSDNDKSTLRYIVK